MAMCCMLGPCNVCQGGVLVLGRCTVCPDGVMCAKVVYCVLRRCTM